MRKSLLLSLLTFLVLWSAGCVVVVKEERRVPTGRAECDFTEEIDAVASLSFDSQRRDAYLRIAQRDCLSDEAQVHLIDEALAKLTFEQSMEQVLVALIRSPSFCCEGRRVILLRLDHLKFDATRSKILEELDERGPCPY